MLKPNMYDDTICRLGENSSKISDNNFSKDSNDNQDDKSTNLDKTPEGSIFPSKLKNKLRCEAEQLAEEEMNEDTIAVDDEAAKEASL